MRKGFKIRFKMTLLSIDSVKAKQVMQKLKSSYLAGIQDQSPSYAISFQEGQQGRGGGDRFTQHLGRHSQWFRLPKPHTFQCLMHERSNQGGIDSFEAASHSQWLPWGVIMTHYGSINVLQSFCQCGMILFFNMISIHWTVIFHLWSS